MLNLKIRSNVEIFVPQRRNNKAIQAKFGTNAYLPLIGQGDTGALEVIEIFDQKEISRRIIGYPLGLLSEAKFGPWLNWVGTEVPKIKKTGQNLTISVVFRHRGRHCILIKVKFGVQQYAKFGMLQ